MIKVTLGKNSYSFPEAWHELKPDEYLLLAKHLFNFINGETTVDEMRATWFADTIGISFKPKDQQNEVLWENIYRISREFTFFTRIEYDGDISVIEPKLRKQLHHYPPSEVFSDDPMLRWVAKLKYGYTIDAVFAKNLLPSITVNGKKVYGYRISLQANMLQTTLTAEQFISAGDALSEYHHKKKPESLNLLIAVLYGIKNPDMVAGLDPITKFAVLLNFQAVSAFLMTKTKYSIIWYRNPKTDDKPGKNLNRFAVGASDSLYALAKLGYGSIDNLAQINLLRYLDLLQKNIIDTVKMLNEYKLSTLDIAERTGLSIEMINEILQP